MTMSQAADLIIVGAFVITVSASLGILLGNVLAALCFDIIGPRLQQRRDRKKRIRERAARREEQQADVLLDEYLRSMVEEDRKERKDEEYGN